MHLGGFGSNGKWGLAVLALALVATSCTTTAEHRKLERRVVGLQRSGAVGAAPSRPTQETESQGEEPVPVSAEIVEYRTAYAKWRAGDGPGCVEHFQKFVKTYPTSDHADDATYWMGDCYFKQGNFAAAVLRFDDVARQYPGGNKAPDALYRQGEALLRMGHGEAASQAFQKVLRDYPDSARVPEAKRQLELLGSG